MGLGYTFRDGDWPRVRQIIQKLSSLNIGPESTPTFAGLTISGDITAATITVNNSGIHILDTGGDDDLILASGEDLSADRTLTITLSDANRAVTFAGDSTINAGTHLDHALTQDANLINWWRMDDVTGTTVTDLAGNTNGTLTNGPTRIPGVLGKAYAFNGINQDINLGAYDDTDGLTSFSVSLWFRMDELVFGSNHPILSLGDAGNRIPWIFGVNGTSTIRAQVFGGAVIVQTDFTLPEAGKWYHLVYTYEYPGNAILYIDGDVKDTDTAIDSSGFASAGTSYIGRFTTSYLDGDVDDVRVYDRVLTPDEVDEITELGTLDAMTAFDAAYFTEYLASRSGFFDTLVTFGGQISTGHLEVTGGLDIDINASDLVGTGHILPEGDAVQNLGSVAKTFSQLFIGTAIVVDDGVSITAGSGEPTLIFDSSNNFFEFTGGNVAIGLATSMLAPLNITGDTADIGDRHEGLWMRSKEGAWIVQVNVRGPRLEIGGGASLDTTPAMSVNYNTGRVGIGTTAPGFILDIDAGEIGDNNYDGLRIIDTGWKAVSHPMLEFYNSHVDFNGSLARIYGEIGSLGENSKLYFAVADSSKNLQNRMVIDKSGNLGIGTMTPDATLQVVGDAHFGEDITNFSEFESDGTLKFNGNATVFRDINIGAVTLSGPPGLQPGIANFVDNLGADTGIATFGLAVGEGFSGEFEMQHDYKEASDITFHIHFQGIAAPTGTDKIQFQLTYTVGHSDTTLAPVTVIPVEVDFDTQYEFKLVSFAPISGSGVHIEDQVLFTLQRIAASVDEYGGEALVATVGIHYEVDTVGSRQILVK